MRLVCSLFLILLFSSCQRAPVLTHFRGVAHTHPYHIQLGGKLSLKKQNQIAGLIQDCFDEIDLYCNRWNPLSELSQLNETEIEEAFSLSPPLSALIKESYELTLLTDGHFDPTLGAVIALWKEKLKKNALAEETLPAGWEFFVVSENKIRRCDSHVKLDLDGLLKGYAIDRILENLGQMGCQNVYVEWGGDIRASGSHPSGRTWQVLFDEEKISLSNCALATSGDREQFWEIGGKRLSHIIIPETKLPIEDHPISAVSVRAPTCILADALATALMTFSSPETAFDWLEKRKERFKTCDVWIHGSKNERLQWRPKL